ncbi:MAG: lysozyme inhibitor LprI family protein [Sphingopyxis sp.]|nr:lysozyme inhibitor LprI family protein [Sphingopyxis sp.]
MTARHILFAVLVPLSVLSTGGARASGAQPADSAVVEDPDCGGNTVQMVQCANRVFDRADRELNLVWKETVAALEREDRVRDDHREPPVDIARKAQKTWLAFRDAQCAAEADGEARGGTLYPLIYIGCRTDMTRVRTQQLRPMVER